MNKKELVEKIAKTSTLNKATSEKVLDGIVTAITGALTKGDDVTLLGFGTFSVAKRNAWEGRNPQNGKKIMIPARMVAKFKAGKALAQNVNR